MTAQPDMFATLIAYPEPADADGVAARNPVAARLLNTWRTHVPAHDEDGTGDFEDFFEMAARLTAALDSGADRVWVHLAGEDHVRLLSNIHDEDWPHPISPDFLHWRMELGEAVHYGPLTRGSVLNFKVDGRADAYPHTQTFRAHAGRSTVVAGYLPDPDEHPDAVRAEEAMARLAADGCTEVIVKTVRAKHGIWRVPASTDITRNREALADALGWSLIHIEGRPGALSIQQIVEMTYEYRVFIVDGEPATGAGCIEEHTPLDADETTAFSPLMRTRRPIRIPTSESDLDHLFNETDSGVQEAIVDPVEARPDLVDTYLAFARQVAAHGLTEGSLPDAYVLDVAMVGEQPVVIEMNGLTNAGLYASQPWLVTRALVLSEAPDTITC